MYKKSVSFSSTVQVNNEFSVSPVSSSIEDERRHYVYRQGKEYIRELPERTRNWIQQCYEAVLDEQVDQWASGESNPEKMANVYKKYSRSSQAKAIAHGLRTRDEIGLSKWVTSA